MKIHLLRFNDGKEFLSSYRHIGEIGGIVFDSRASLKKGEFFVLEIKFPNLPNRVLIKSEVTSVFNKNSEKTKLHCSTFPHNQNEKKTHAENTQTIEARFLISEKPKETFLLDMAQFGEQKKRKPAKRRYRRFPVDMTVKWQIKGLEYRHRGRVEDLSNGGMFVRTEWTPPKGTELKLTIHPDDEQGTLGLFGKVTWISQDWRTGGMGIQFKHNNQEELRRIRRLLRHISNCGESTHQMTKNPDQDTRLTSV